MRKLNCYICDYCRRVLAYRDERLAEQEKHFCGLAHRVMYFFGGGK